MISNALSSFIFWTSCTKSYNVLLVLFVLPPLYGANNSSFYLGSTSKTFAFCIDGKPNVFKLGTSPDGDAGYTVRTTKAPVPKSTGTC